MFLRKQLSEILEKTDIPFCFFYNSYLVITLTGKKKKDGSTTWKIMVEGKKSSSTKYYIEYFKL